MTTIKEAHQLWNLASPITAEFCNAVRYLHDESGNRPPNQLIVALRNHPTGEVREFHVVELYAGDDYGSWPINIDVIEVEETSHQELKIGEKVRLKGNLAKMVIATAPANQDGRLVVRCVWQSDGKKPESEFYPVDALERVIAMTFSATKG